MRRRRRLAWRDDTGAQAVEFAVIVPVLLVLITGIVSMGIALSAQVSIVQAAREGARYAAICDQDATCLGNVKAKVESGAGITLTDSEITVNACPAPTTPADPQRSASVTVTYTSAVGIYGFSPAQYTLNLKGTASTPCGG